MSDDRLNGLATFDPRPLTSGESFGFTAVQNLHAFETASTPASFARETFRFHAIVPSTDNAQTWKTFLARSIPTIEMFIFASPHVGKVPVNSTRACRNRLVMGCPSHRYIIARKPEVAAQASMASRLGRPPQPEASRGWTERCLGHGLCGGSTGRWETDQDVDDCRSFHEGMPRDRSRIQSACLRCRHRAEPLEI